MLLRRNKSKAQAKRDKKWFWLVVPIALCAAGLYLLLNIFSPALPPTSFKVSEKTEASKIKENRLYIPDIGVDVAIVEGGEEVLEKGAWHRKPENGNPQKGSNFVLSAHRFELGWTPQQTRARSPFYHIDKLESGDKIFVDYNKKRYAYEVTKKYKVDRFAIAIEAPSDEAKMTLYSCDLRGEAAGREVVEARPI